MVLTQDYLKLLERAHRLPNIARSAARKIVCVGRNYDAHIKELNNSRPSRPFFFLKPASSIIRQGDGRILRPKGVTLHYEVELGVVLQSDLKMVRDDDDHTIQSAIGGYILGLDMTARNIQDECKAKGLPWTMAKGFDTFLPLSRLIAPSEIPDVDKVRLWLKVNGEMKQDGSCADMIFKVPELLSEISSGMTLFRNDIVLTGTPEGVGEVVPGDVIEAGLDIDDENVTDMTFEVDQRYGRYQYGSKK